MLGFRVQINGRKHLNVSVDGNGVASLVLALQKSTKGRAPKVVEKVILQAGSLEAHQDFSESKAWPDKRLSPGDKIVIEVMDIERMSPVKTVAKTTEKSKKLAKLAYLRRLKKELKES